MVNQLSEKQQKLAEVDSGIGCLPDLILCQILSYLPTIDAVATSALARRWRFLWTHVPNIEFDMSDFDPYPVNGICFSEIVNRVLLLNNVQCLKKFSLCFVCDLNEHQFDSWIRTVIARHIQVINVSFVERFRLPDCLFNCKSLTDLALSDCFCRVPRAAFLPCLKKLCLSDVEYENDDSLPNLISGCLVLEVLRITMDIDESGGMLRCNISSPSLICLDLRISLNWPRNPRTYGPERKLVLYAPALRYLTVKDDLSHHISAQMLCSVVKADVDLQNCRMKEDISYSHDVFAFVARLYNVKRLKLSSHRVMTFLDSPLLSPISRFDYLMELDWKADWRLLTKLLQCADKLEVLTIREVDFKLKCWRVPEHIPMCLSLSLQTVIFYGFGSGDHEFEMLRYILRHAKDLKIMKICSLSGSDINYKLRALQQISRFPRGSDACEIDFF